MATFQTDCRGLSGRESRCPRIQTHPVEVENKMAESQSVPSKLCKKNQRCYQPSREKTNVAVALLGEGYGDQQALRHVEALQDVQRKEFEIVSKVFSVQSNPSESVDFSASRWKIKTKGLR